jgi:hypothetical protein
VSEILILRRLVAGEARFMARLIAGSAVREVGESQPPVAAYFVESLTMN